MPRRAILIFSLASLALLAFAVAPWTLSPGGFAAAVAHHLEDAYGVTFKVRGRSTIALLPMPRIKFEDVSLRSADGTVAAEGGILRGQLDLLPLLLGRAELSEISLANTTVTVAETPSGLFGGEKVSAFVKAHGPDRTSDLPHLRRLVLTDTSVTFAGGASPIERATVTVAWPDPDSVVEVSGHLTWRGERVDIVGASVDPSALVAGRKSAFAASLDSPSARLAVTGDVQPGRDWKLTGHSAITWQSVRDFSRWSGLELPLGGLVQAASVSGDFIADRRRVSWPSATVTLGADQLEGTLGIRFDSERPVVTGTLATDKVDLSEFVMPFARARTASGLWSGDEMSLASSTGGDLDLRFSATSAQIGRLKLGEMAANVLVRPGRIEASLNRATLNQGNVKARVGLTALAAGGLDFKAQGSFEGVEIGALLAETRHARWMTGQAQGSFTLEGTGATPVDVVRQSHGRSTVTVKQGELVGIGLADALQRIEKRPLSAFLDWRGGRTTFDQAHLTLNIGAGLGEIVDGAVIAPDHRTALHGRVSLIDRAVAIKAQVDAIAPGAGPGFELDVTGGWDDITVVPDVRALIERSGAAKPLFGRERLAPQPVQGASATPAGQ